MKLNYKVFLLIIILSIYIFHVSATDGVPTTNTGGGFDPNAEGYEADATHDEVETIITTDIRDGIVNFFKDVFNKNPATTTQVVKEVFNFDLFENFASMMDQFSITRTPSGDNFNDKKNGNNVLTDPDTPLSYTPESDGGTLEIKTSTPQFKIAGAYQMTFTNQNLFKALRARQIDYQNTVSTNVQNYEVKQGTITASSAESFNVPGTAVGCTNCKNIVFSQDDFRVAAADTVTYQTTTSTNVNNYEGKKGTFTVTTADSVTIGSTTFTDVKDSTFSVINNRLVYADVKSAKDNNTATLENPIKGSSPDIKVDYAENSSFEVSIMPNQVDFTMSKGVFLNMSKITFRAAENNAKMKIEAAETPEYSMSRGTLEFTEKQFTEYIISECRASTAKIDFDAGFIQVILSPVLTALCPGCRYSYIAKDDKEKSYSLLNTGYEDYTIGFYKDGFLPYAEFLNSTDTNSWGYVKLPENIELNAVITYDRFREFMPQIESMESYNSAELEFMPVYMSFDYSNRALLNLIGGKNVNLTILNSNIDNKTDVAAEMNTGFHRIIEKKISGHVFRFEDFNRQPKSPPYVLLYSSDLEDNTPLMGVIDKTLGRICNSTQAIVVFTPNTEAEKLFRDKLQAWAAVSYDNMLEKYGPEKDENK